MQKGDTVTVSAYGLYPQAEQRSFFFSLASFLANLLHPAATPPPGQDGRRRQDLPLLQVGVAAGLAAIPQLSGGVPQGYLRLLIFNQDSALVSQQVQPLTQAANGSYESLRLQVLLPQDGYVTAYVGNESDVDVYFDDVTIEHRQGLQVQENQYDPWGIGLMGVNYTTPNLIGINKYNYEDKEECNNLGLHMQDFGWRLYNAELGMWHGIDQLSDLYVSVSPYQYVKDNPILFKEIDGRYFDFSGLNKVERREVQTILNNLRKNDKVFNVLYKELSSSKAKFSIGLDSKQNDPGLFKPDSKTEYGGSITFRTVNDAKQENATIEEFFHGYQNLYYGGKDKMAKLGANVEAEPRFLKLFDSYFLHPDAAIGVFPGAEQLNNFTIFLSPDLNKLSDEQKAQYLQAVKSFQEHFVKQNKATGINNFYNAPPTSVGPNAALEVIREARKLK